MKKLLLVFTILFIFLSYGIHVNAIEPSEESQDALRCKIIAALNDIRSELSLSEFVLDDSLSKPANIRAYEASILWSHTRPDGSPYYSADTGKIYGENLYRSSYAAYDADSFASYIVQKWMDSPSHRANIEDSLFDRLGLGIYTAPDNIIYIAMELTSHEIGLN